MKTWSESCVDTCTYCDMLLPPRHEHDHFPEAKRHGGKKKVCACLNCHELKDRTPLQNWDAGSLMQAMVGLWKKASPAERVLLAKLVTLARDAWDAIGPPATLPETF